MKHDKPTHNKPTHNKPTSDNLPTQRSWMATYGPALTFGVVVLGLGALLFTTVPATVTPTPPPAPSSVDLEKESETKTKQMEEQVKKAAEMSGGDWGKVPAELKSSLNSLSSGHGPEMLKMYLEREANMKQNPEKKPKK